MKQLILERLKQLVEAQDRIIPYDERPELRAAAKNGIPNKEVISDERFNQIMAQLVQAKQIAVAYADAYKQGLNSFVVNWMGQKMIGRIPDALLKAVDPRGNPIDFSRYFEIPNLGDGGFQYKLYPNGNIVGGNVLTRPDQIHNPNMSSATDAGYNRTFDDRIKYLQVKAGFLGKYQDEGKPYSVFATPAIDGAIKVRVTAAADITDFLSKDKGAKQYTADKKGEAISDSMETKKKIEKIRKDAEAVIGKPISSNQYWMAFRDDLIKSLETQPEFNVGQKTQEFLDIYKKNNSNVGKPEISLPSDEMDAFKQRQAAMQARVDAMRARRK